uniref:Amine oxidase n=1 Tax=Rhizophora mucronata TaxID=61149 RepID=A0A2P2Q6T0_RHIMU
MVQTIVKKSYPSSSHNLTFQYVGLDEPEKPDVLSWLSKPTTKAPSRHALAITRVNKQTHEIVVDLSKGLILSDDIYRGSGYPLLTYEEQIAAILLPLKYGPFVKSAENRGINVSEVVCSTFTKGWFGDERKTKRVLIIQCFHTKDTVNLYLRPIEGVEILVDLDEMNIVEYSDRYRMPVPKAEGTDYRLSTQKPPLGPRINGAAIMQSDEQGFEIDGHTIR